MYGCQTIALWEDRVLRMFENRVVRRTILPNRGELGLTGVWITLYNYKIIIYTIHLTLLG
jgi:hypothetical protein